MSRPNSKFFCVFESIYIVCNKYYVIAIAILVVFQQEDCEWCELLVDKVLSNPEVQKELNKRFIVTFVDMNENYKLADEYNILGTPTEVFLDYEGNEIDRIQGYEREDKFMTKLKEI